MGRTRTDAIAFIVAGSSSHLTLPLPTRPTCPVRPLSLGLSAASRPPFFLCSQQPANDVCHPLGVCPAAGQALEISHRTVHWPERVEPQVTTESITMVETRTKKDWLAANPTFRPHVLCPNAGGVAGPPAGYLLLLSTDDVFVELLFHPAFLRIFFSSLAAFSRVRWSLRIDTTGGEIG